MRELRGGVAAIAAKFGVRGFTESLREDLEYARARLSVTCVHPGGGRTNIVRRSGLGVFAA